MEIRKRSVLDHLRGAAAAPDGGLSDGELLQRFLDQRDESAFAGLVRRHGPMVLGVCRRVLSDGHAAEDAFQATFLVLVRKGASIVPREQVGNWLYGVAYRTARKALATSARLRSKERQVQDVPQPETTDPEAWHDLQPLLDQELHRLPDKYRVPVVLCDLEGKSRKEAAHQLGWPEGTLSWRLASARTLLAKRLSRRGVALSAGALATLLSSQASAGVPPALLGSTVQAGALLAAGETVTAGVISADVATLTEGVLKAMFWSKCKIPAILVLAVSALGTGLGIVSYRGLAETFQAEEPRGENAVAAEGERERERPREERKPVDVSGKVSAISGDGKTLTVESGGRGEEPKKVEVKLTDKTKVEFNGLLKEAGLKLRDGDRVAVHFQAGSKDTAETVVVDRAADLSGKITAVAEGKSVTIEVPGEARGEKKTIEIKITDKTRIGKPRGNGEVKPVVGDTATAWLQEGSKDTAVALTFSPPSADVNGEVVAISKDGKVLTVEYRTRAAEPTQKEIKLGDGTKIDSAVAEGADKTLKIGNHIAVWLAEGSTDTAAKVQITSERRGADLSGKISAISKDGKVVTLEIPRRGGDPLTQDVKLSDKTLLEYKGIDNEKDKKLAVGNNVMIWLEAGSKDTARIIQTYVPMARERER